MIFTYYLYDEDMHKYFNELHIKLMFIGNYLLIYNLNIFFYKTLLLIYLYLYLFK